MLNQKDSASPESVNASGRTAQPMDAPDGLDLHPLPRRAVRVSKRAGMVIILAIVGLLVAFAYGGYRRTQKAQAAARDAGVPTNAGPATQAGTEVLKNIPEGTAPLTSKNIADLRPPDQAKLDSAHSPCESNPQNGQSFRFNPETGQPCDGLPQERLVVRRSPLIPPVVRESIAQSQEQSPEKRRIAASYAREQEARIAPTAIRASVNPSFQVSPTNSRPTVDELTQALALAQSTPDRNPKGTAIMNMPASATEGEYDEQNMQTRKESFWAGPRKEQGDDYLNTAREAPLSRFEIKAGWEIPAVLEQSLNSDLPGDLKALIDANVYDTATGQYLLIPQGSRLVGRYDSRVAYGQDGVQVTWSRIIFPDASSIDLNGMVGLDSHGNAGLRDKVDRHYGRIVSFSALTSLFSGAFAISQRRSQSVLAYPTPGEAASSAVAQNLNQTGSQITRRNLNVQPTVKVPVGYKFTVRVNRDILFEEPYAPVNAKPLITPDRTLRRQNGE